MNLITYQFNKTTGTTARQIQSFGSYDGALSSFYGSLRASINDANIESCTAILQDDSGVTHKFDAWTREAQPEPEPEPEPEG